MSSSIDSLVNREYQYGFVTDVEADTIPPGLSEDVIRLISAKKVEPSWLLNWRLDRKSTRLNSSHLRLSRMPSSA